MDTVTRILLGLAIAAIGTGFVFKTTALVDFFGPVEWAERHIGGTSMFYKLVGVVIIIAGFIVTTNLWNAFLGATLGQVIPGLKRQ